MTDDERIPEPEPSGALVPPPTYPSTGLATSAPLPPRRWDDDDVDRRARLLHSRRSTARSTRSITVGDSIASAVGLR